jgi:DNA repair exonuclease SbcCD ATPase subunit
VDWAASAQETDLTESDVSTQPDGSHPGARYETLPAEATKPRAYEQWKKDLADALFRTQKLDVQRCAALGIVSGAEESERDFRARLSQTAREQRDALVEKLRAKYQPKLQTLADRLRRAEQAVEVQRGQARDAKLSTAVSFGSALLGAFLGRKTLSSGNISRAGTAMRGVSRSARESGDVGRAEETVEAVQQQLAELQAEFDRETQDIGAQFDPAHLELEGVSLRPKKTNVKVRAVALVWGPMWVGSGPSRAAWE